MPTLTIRGLPDDVHKRLRIRAARAGRSMEAEVRAILTETCAPRSETSPVRGVREWVDRVYGADKPTGVVEDLIEERRRESARE